LSIPNLVTLGRILLVPVVIWAITAGEMRIAFSLFLAAGITDAVDGFLAKRFGMRTESAPISTASRQDNARLHLCRARNRGGAARWLVILVVSRDIMIVGAVILSWLVHKPDRAPAAARLQLNDGCADCARMRWSLRRLGSISTPAWRSSRSRALVAALTLISVAFYVVEWMRHMNGRPNARIGATTQGEHPI